MDKNNIEKLKEKYCYYKNNKNEYINIRENVKKQVFYKKTPVQNPIAYIVISQTGGGKSSLKNFILKDTENVVCADSDYCKTFLSYCGEVTQKYPELYNTLTRSDAYQLENDMLEIAVGKKYNLVIESSGKLRILDKLLDNGYKINICVLATSKYNSEFSILKRYVEQVLDKDIKYPKLTEITRHEQSFVNVRKLVKELQDTFGINISIYGRGKSNMSKLPLIYKKGNEQYNCPYEALLSGQNIDAIKFKQNYSFYSAQLEKKINQAKDQISQVVLEEILKRLVQIKKDVFADKTI